MAGEQTRMLWALVYLIGLIATHYLVGQGMLMESWALWAWLVILAISQYSIGMSRNIKSSAVKSAGMITCALFIVLAGTMLLNLWSVGTASSAAFFALFLLLNGALIFAMGHEMKRVDWVTFGLYSVGLGIVFPGWFASAPYLAAALILGVPLLIGTLKH
jgi:hypothetical protein